MAGGLFGEVLQGDVSRLLVGVREQLLSVDPLLFLIFRRRASGALVTSWRRNPARCARWNAFIIVLICERTEFTEVLLKLSTSGVASGVVENTSSLLPRTQSLVCTDSNVSRCFGSTVSRPVHSSRLCKRACNITP